MDEVSRYNRERWNALATAGVGFSRPWLDLSRAEAGRRVDPQGMLGDVDGRDVLLLAGGGGQQSAAFALLGARVSVFDLSDVMLDRDRETADHYEVDVVTIQGDVRDMSALATDDFDHVWQAHSLSFVSDLEDFAGTPRRIRGPREFRHTLTVQISGLLERGFVLFCLDEEPLGDPDAEPGSWEHFCSIAPPWIVLWATLRPDLMAGAVRYPRLVRRPVAPLPSSPVGEEGER